MTLPRVVRDYDAAIRFFVDVLQFELVEDAPSLTKKDLPTFVAVTAVFATVALVACCVPALKATDVDPANAIRYE